jgi:hypothetical protein
MDFESKHPLLLDALQAPLQKIDLHRLLTDLPLQLGDPALAPARLPDIRRRLGCYPGSLRPVFSLTAYETLLP